MNLYIGFRPKNKAGLYLSTDALRDRDSHLFILSNRWDTIYIELSDKVLPYCLKYIKNSSNEVKVRFKEQTKYTLALLIELYPDLEGVLRKKYVSGGNLNEVLSGLWWNGT
jgi:hypothetical protein